MNKILLDTNFIITCVKNKVDFYEELYMGGYDIIIPDEVLIELKNLGNKAILDFLSKKKFKKIKLNSKNVDNGIVNYAKENPEITIATLDREMKAKIRNPKMVIRSRKKLEIV